jgi:hypothetical protein
MFLQQFKPTLNFEDNTIIFTLADGALPGVSFVTAEVETNATTNTNWAEVIGTFGAVLSVGTALFLKSRRTKSTTNTERLLI